MMSPSVFRAGTFSVTSIGMPRHTNRGRSRALSMKIVSDPPPLAVICRSLEITVLWTTQQVCLVDQPGNSLAYISAASDNVKALAAERATEIKPAQLRMPSGLATPSPRQNAESSYHAPALPKSFKNG